MTEESECNCIEGVCSCSYDEFKEQFKDHKKRHKHLGNECIHEDGKHHRLL
ncbi:MAG: hypothetical protein PVH93_08455 [Nitrosopumilaceae archaeon]|jgi:hypothetical protein